MKRLLWICAAVIVAVSAVLALDNITPPTDGSFYDGVLIAGRRDTNVTTVATQYTPRRVGDILVGGAGVGTGAVWVAKALTSNDWTQAGLGTDMGTVNAAITAAILNLPIARLTNALAGNVTALATNRWVEDGAASTSTVVTANVGGFVIIKSWTRSAP